MIDRRNFIKLLSTLTFLNIEINESADKVNHDEAIHSKGQLESFLIPNETIDYTFEVKNIGEVVLENVCINGLSDIVYHKIDRIDPQETKIIHGSYTNIS